MGMSNYYHTCYRNRLDDGHTDGYANGVMRGACVLNKYRKVINDQRARIAELEKAERVSEELIDAQQNTINRLIADNNSLTKHIAELEAANAALCGQLAAYEEAQLTDVQKYLSQIDEDATVYETDRSAGVRR
jgi:predicted RNase H-like nuclease (RuvC/YqgF family)